MNIWWQKNLKSELFDWKLEIILLLGFCINCINCINYWRINFHSVPEYSWLSYLLKLNIECINQCVNYLYLMFQNKLTVKHFYRICDLKFMINHFWLFEWCIINEKICTNWCFLYHFQTKEKQSTGQSTKINQTKQIIFC